MVDELGTNDDELQRNTEIVNECILVFFNLEILREQIQNKVNQTLKIVSNSWKKAVTDIQNMGSNTSIHMSKREETQRIQDILLGTVTEMKVNTKRMY